MPYMSKLVEVEEGILEARKNLRGWWGRVVERKTYREVIMGH